ncbi:MAG: hypothetical protein HUK07_05550, partial [Bacteroidaceae bacterium]|nr:hypothetical protein [Bacteroidaceae bacterium]
IDTQGRISSSGAGTTNREYTGFNSGQLSTDSAIASMAGDGKWWSFDTVLQKVYFLKHIIAGGLNTEGQTVGFDRIDIFSTGSDDGLFFNSHRLNGVANDSTPVDNDTKIVTPLYLMGKYLSSLVDDVAQGIIRFVKGIKFGSASSGYKIDGNGNAVLNDIEGHDVSVNDISSHDIFNSNNILTKNLTVSGTAHFFEVVIDKARATGGTMFQTPASAKIDKVVETETNVYKLYFLATDADGVSITNDFLVDDQIFLQTFNLGTGTSYQAGNRMYWCLCLSIGTETIAEENRTYHYLTVGFRTPGIDKEYHANSNARPAAGDEIVVLGTRNNSEESKLRRQNTILISSVQVGFLNLHQKGLPNKPLVPPMIVQLQGINTFAIQDGTSSGEQGANNYGNVISKEYNSFVGEFNVYNEGAITPLKTEQSREMRFKTTYTFSAPTVDDTTWPEWSQAFIEPTSSYPYLWKATRILYTDNTHSYTVEFTSSYTAGQSSFTSTMFKRSDTQPTATSEILTTEGDYNNPSPEVKGWTDGIPEGDERLWMQTRIFSNNGLPPQETTWRLPMLAADNPGMDVCYNASETQPDPPQEHGTQTTGGWHDNGTPSDNWMAVSYKTEGQWGEWVISRIKGEEGYTFTTIDEEFGNSDYPEYPERVTWGNPAPESGKYRWRRYKLQKMRATIVISVSDYYYECIGYYGEDGSGEDAIALVATGQFGTVSV